MSLFNRSMKDLKNCWKNNLFYLFKSCARKNVTMAANDNETSNIVKTEIAKGERNEVFEEYTRSEREEMRDKLRSKVSTTITVKVNVIYIQYQN